MNKKLLIGGAAVALSGLALYRLITHENEPHQLVAGKWTTAYIPDLSGKVIIVTGANSGIGFEAAKEFARNGAQTILACRNMAKAEAALAEIKTEIPEAQATIMELDLNSLDSVRHFAQQFKSQTDRLDILVNNAGIMMVPQDRTEDGFEKQLGVNHLGHFALTGLLIDLILQTPGARVVNISSNAHKRGEMDFDDLMFENDEAYTPSSAYNRSKLANILFSNELQRRFEAAGADAIALSAHPGISETNLADHLFEDRAEFAKPVMGKLMPSAAMGALPTLRAAVDPQAQGGDYYGPDGFNSMRGYPVKIDTAPAAQNAADARKLWEVSEELTGVHYTALDEKA